MGQAVKMVRETMLSCKAESDRVSDRRSRNL